MLKISNNININDKKKCYNNLLYVFIIILLIFFQFHHEDADLLGCHYSKKFWGGNLNLFRKKSFSNYEDECVRDKCTAEIMELLTLKIYKFHQILDLTRESLSLKLSKGKKKLKIKLKKLNLKEWLRAKWWKSWLNLLYSWKGNR